MDTVERLFWMMNKKLLFVCMSLLLVSSAHAREITDMTGRRVVVPDRIERVFASSPPATYMLYAMDPAKLIGTNTAVKEREMKYLRPEYSRLPVTGGAMGQGRNINMEVLLALKPDIVLAWSSHGAKSDQLFAEQMRKMGIPVVFISLDRLEDYPETFRFMGELLGQRERAKILSSYAVDTLQAAARTRASIQQKEKVSVYYAEGTDGLATEGEKSWHAQLIPMSGGRNVHRGKQLDQVGMEKISLEQVIMYDPQVIVTHDRSFYAGIYQDRRWQRISAVKSKRVYLIPNAPFNWFDRPPSFMRLLGLKWLESRLYPKRFKLDMYAETKKFYRLFLGVELNEHDVQEILNR